MHNMHKIAVQRQSRMWSLFESYFPTQTCVIWPCYDREMYNIKFFACPVGFKLLDGFLKTAK